MISRRPPAWIKAVLLAWELAIINEAKRLAKLIAIRRFVWLKCSTERISCK